MAIYKNYTAGMNLVIQENGEDVYYRFGEANFNGSNGNKFKIAPNFHVLSQDMYSTTIRVFLDWVSLGYSGSGSRVYGYINGTQLENSYTSISANQSRYMGCKDITIYHSDTTGQGSADVTCLVDTPWSLGDAQSTTTIYTNVYPRASTPSASNTDIESSVRINIDRKSSSFTHTITVTFGSFSRTWNNVGDAVEWNTNDNKSSLYAQIPNSPNGTCTVTCTTYNGGTQVGSAKTCTFTLTAKESICKPNVTISGVDTNKSLDTGNTIQDLTGDINNKTVIKYLSDVQVLLSATPKNSASIVSTRITSGNGTFVTGTGNMTTVFPNVETASYIGRAEDSRRYPNTADVGDLTLLDYVKLSIDPVKLYRTNQTDNKLYAEINGNYFKGSFNNTANILTLSFKYKESNNNWTGNEQWITLTPTISQSSNSYSFDGLLGNDFDYTKIYDFVFKVEDLAMIQTIEASSTPGIPIIGIFEDFIELWGEVFVYR